MAIDLVMGFAALLIAAALLHFKDPLARDLQVTDDRWRERFPWVRQFEPQTGHLATDDGRLLILRGSLVAAGIAFAAVGTLLALRAVL